MSTISDDNPKRRPPRFKGLRASFLTGLVVIAPGALTIWLIWAAIGWIDGVVLPLIPDRFRPETYIGVNLRGVGVLIFLVFTVIVGWLAKGLIGRSLIRYAEGIVDRMPVVRTIYAGIKQISEAVFTDTGRKFDKVCLVEYPRKGVWAIGFISAPARGEITTRIGAGEDLLGVFVPTTPNPTSGFLLLVPRADVIELDMSLEDGAKLIITAGLVYPSEPAPRSPPKPAAPLS